MSRLVLIAAVVVGVASVASAQVPFYNYGNYPPGQTLLGRPSAPGAKVGGPGTTVAQPERAHGRCDVVEHSAALVVTLGVPLVGLAQLGNGQVIGSCHR